MAKAKKVIRKYYKKGRWSANIKNIQETLDVDKDQTFFYNQILCENPPQAQNSVSQQYTAKNFEFTFELESTSNDELWFENLMGYIMFVPQGYNVDDQLPFKHPEWIMAYKYYGSPKADETPLPIFRIRTRLARRLQTGDSIIFLLIGRTQAWEGTSKKRLNPKGLVRWWTKAN